MNKSCKLADSGLYVSQQGLFSSCCLQEWPDGQPLSIDWNSVSSLNELHQRKELEIIRQDLKDDVENSACRLCWVHESNNNKSRRNYINERKIEPGLTFLDLRLSNKCNLQCKMCWAGNSDQLENLGKELHDSGIMPNNYLVEPIPAMDTSMTMDMALKLPNLGHVGLAGGEPFIMPEVEQFLTKLVEQGKTNISLEITTNCTIVKPSVIELLNKFKTVLLRCSIDGMEDDIEYQRYPVKWDRVKQTFDELYNSKCNIVISPCISMLNMLNIDKFINWRNENYPKARLLYSSVDNPRSLNYKFIPLENRQEFIERSKNLKLDGMLIEGRWKTFFEKEIYEYVEPTVEDCADLAHRVAVWDYKCKVKFSDKYPYMKYMLDIAKNKEI